MSAIQRMITTYNIAFYKALPYVLSFMLMTNSEKVDVIEILTLQRGYVSYLSSQRE